MSKLKWQLIIVTFLLYQRSLSAQDIPSKRIVEGFNADPKQFPYQVYLMILKDSHPFTACGGVIISNRIVLTAGHCIPTKFNAVKINFGTVDISNKMEVGQQQLIVKAKNVFVHPEYELNNKPNDIALIKLPADLLFDEYIQPAKLPDANELYENESAVVSGWGTTSYNGPQPNHLQYYNVTVYSNEECKNKLVPDIFPSSYICLKPSQSSPCYGDSGGPLAIRNEDGSHTLLGLTSFGSETCEFNSPPIYTRVSSYLQWIKKFE
ncbi:chymotrypsin-2-like [Drosophila albomicans]|uniref:Chymotrypsin-2-like n=1 Tax=Drosophila albomicans TaxID=7291 RepID=A0A6P8X419_DROAB|nr:chymotrypsin-2-like [Drosophila albomicans]